MTARTRTAGAKAPLKEKGADKTRSTSDLRPVGTNWNISRPRARKRGNSAEMKDMSVFEGVEPLNYTSFRLLEIDVLCRHRLRCFKSLDPSVLRRSWNSPVFQVAKEYQDVDSIADSLHHPNNIRKRILAKDHGPLREFCKPSVSCFACDDGDWFS